MDNCLKEMILLFQLFNNGIFIEFKMKKAKHLKNLNFKVMI